MDAQFRALPMTRQCARTAYPLVHLHDASISLEDWLRFARRRSRNPLGRAGLIAIRDCRDIIHALFSYRVDIDLHTRKRLYISNLVVAHLTGSAIDDAIAASANKVAARLGCQTISLERPFHSRFHRTADQQTCPLVKVPS